MNQKPTQDEAAAAMWAILGPALADAVREGKIDPMDYPRELRASA